MASSLLHLILKQSTDLPTLLQDSHEIVDCLTLYGEKVLYIESLVFAPADGQVSPLVGIQQVNDLAKKSDIE